MVGRLIPNPAGLASAKDGWRFWILSAPKLVFAQPMRLSSPCLPLLLFLMVVPVDAQFLGEKVIEVRNGTEFLRALGSDRKVRLMGERVDLTAAGGVVEVRGVKNLRIVGAAPTGTELVSRSGGGLVRFEQCHNLDLRRLSLRLESQATDVVLSLSGVTNVLVRECSLAAVAATALQLKDVSRLKLHKTTVLNSGAGILRASECRNLRAEGCAFRRNEGEHGFELRDVYDLELDGCEFV
jgi:hypothetical protein